MGQTQKLWSIVGMQEWSIVHLIGQSHGKDIVKNFIYHTEKFD